MEKEWNLKQFVSGYYTMNPDLDDLLFDGNELREGMEVLIEDANERMGIHEHIMEQSYHMALMRNRWCTVTNLVLEKEYVSFIGAYSDGMKIKWRMPIHLAWLVRKTSIKAEDR